MRLVRILGLMALVAALAGCMQVKMETVLDEDGGGTYAFTATMSKDVEEAMGELRALGGQTAQQMKDAPDFTDFDRAAFEKKLAEHDVKLLAFDNKLEGDNRVVSMKLGFKSVQDLTRGASAGLGGGLALTRDEDGNYVLELAKAEEEEPEVESAVEEESAAEEQDPQAAMQDAAKSMEIMGKLMAHISEMSVQMAISVPGEILDSNAQKVEGKTASWSIDSSNMMQMQGFQPRVVFSGAGLDIKTD